jgi:hypothetical protein
MALEEHFAQGAVLCGAAFWVKSFDS